MYGDKGVELIKEAVRAGDNLAPFNEDSVRYALGTRKHIRIKLDTRYRYRFILVNFGSYLMKSLCL